MTTSYELTDKEAALIDALRGDNAGALGMAFARALPSWTGKRSASDPIPADPPIPAPAPAQKRHKKSKFRLWLVAHGLEFSASYSGYVYNARSLSITINHRYYGVDLVLPIHPFRGVFDDELDTPHAEIAAQYEREDES